MSARAKAGLTPLAVAVFEGMVESACRRDRLCFASQTTIAQRVGCSRGAVNRAQRDLERAGWIVRRDKTLPSGREIRRSVVWGFGRGVRRLLHNCRPSDDRRTISKCTTTGPGTSKLFRSSNLTSPRKKRTSSGQRIDLKIWNPVAKFVCLCRRDGLDPPDRRSRDVVGGYFRRILARDPSPSVAELRDRLEEWTFEEYLLQHRHRRREAKDAATAYPERIRRAVEQGLLGWAEELRRRAHRETCRGRRW